MIIYVGMADTNGNRAFVWSIPGMFKYELYLSDS